MTKRRKKLNFLGWLAVLLLASACIGRTNTPPSINTPLPASPLPATGIVQPNKASTTTPLPLSQETPTKPLPSAFERPVILSGHTSAVTHLSWSPDGSLLASSCGDFESQDDTIRIWRADGTLATTLKGHIQPVTGLSWSPDGKILATSSLDETIRLWRPDGSLEKVLQGNAGHVFAVVWSPDGKILASGSIIAFLNPTIQLWNKDRKVIKTMSTSFSGGKFYNLGWSPDGQFLLGGATDYKLWKSDGTEVFWMERSEASTPAWGMAWATNSKFWAIGDENGYLSIYDTHGTQAAEMHDQGGVTSLAWSADSQKIASAKTLFLEDGSIQNRLNDQPEYVNSVSWSPDGKLLASGGSDALVHLWTSEGKQFSILSGHTGNIRAVAWSPNGKILASASEDMTIRLWKLK